MLIRAARPDEAGFLSDLAVRAKGHWGYDAAFLRACRVQLAVRPEDVAERRVTVAEEDGAVVGFYALEGEPPAGVLDLMFVEPDHIGRGIGRRLWAHVVDTARGVGLTSFSLDSDPFAEPFYLTMGAVRVGTSPSAVRPGRELPRLTFTVPSS
ncbi:GNAT family N-acetyltransferase [Actinophytocola sp.]|uniref:GNAT family N-acetyltransferase n=1 Tax=Actinophytocola sp. TaxID=1872138 RepID=UPI002ED6B682